MIASAKTKRAILQRQTSRQVKGYNKGRKTYNKISPLHAQIDCPACGRSLDRHLNASMNILNWEPSAVGG